MTFAESVIVPPPVPLFVTLSVRESSPVPVIVAVGGPPLIVSEADFAPYDTGSN
jgi:hypothetical protein